MDYVKLGQILKAGRIQSGSIQSDIAFLFGVTSASVSSWERGRSRMDIETYVKLCNKYGLDPVEVLKACNDDFAPSTDDSLLSLSSVEKQLVLSFRSLSDGGRAYLQQQMSIACAMFAGKNNATSDMEAPQ